MQLEARGHGDQGGAAQRHRLLPPQMRHLDGLALVHELEQLVQSPQLELRALLRVEGEVAVPQQLLARQRQRLAARLQRGLHLVEALHVLEMRRPPRERSGGAAPVGIPRAQVLAVVQPLLRDAMCDALVELGLVSEKLLELGVALVEVLLEPRLQSLGLGYKAGVRASGQGQG